LNPFKLNAIVEIPKAVNQIPTTGHAAKKKKEHLYNRKRFLRI
jgi:hypothetical protein